MKKKKRGKIEWIKVKMAEKRGGGNDADGLLPLVGIDLQNYTSSPCWLTRAAIIAADKSWVLKFSRQRCPMSSMLGQSEWRYANFSTPGCRLRLLGQSEWRNVDFSVLSCGRNGYIMGSWRLRHNENWRDRSLCLVSPRVVSIVHFFSFPVKCFK